ncbi:MAG: hypothetical protein HOP28_17770, partial [Gemmatimonadales bacterium]|nr:hypothetical protein [Gemmatimonadales bacterium]
IDRIVTPVLERADQVFGREYSAVLYGSGAREEYLAGVSDVNLLIVADAMPVERLRALHAALAGLERERQPLPLLIEREEWRRATDVFPIEIADMTIARKVLRGPDPVADLRVEAGDLRRVLESELLGKLLHLRQAYALYVGDETALGAVAGSTVSSIAALFRVALSLHGKSVPAATPACLAAAGQAMGIVAAPVVELWQKRSPKGFGCAPSLFEGYVTAVSAAVRVIDQFSEGGN